MTVTTTDVQNVYAGNSATTSFPITYQFFDATDIAVSIISGSADVTAAYTVTINGGKDSNGLPATGSVNISPAPEAGSSISLRRSTSLLQQTVYQEGTSFPAKTVESLADRVTLIAQESAFSAAQATLIYEGEWADNRAYDLNDLVTLNGSTYICTSAHTSTPLTEPGSGADFTTVWNIFSSSGTDAFNWRAAWSTPTAYTVDDAVSADGSSYICKLAHTSTTDDRPGTGANWQTYWDIFAEKGVDNAGSLLVANNLSDLNNAGAARNNIGLGPSNTPQFTAINIGDANDTTLTRQAPGVLSVEGNIIFSKMDKATNSQYRNASVDKIITADRVWTAAEEAEAGGFFDNINNVTIVAVNFNSSIDFFATLSGNATLENPTNPREGRRGRIRIIQDATGGRTLSFGSNYVFANGSAPTLSTDPNAEDVLYYDCLSTTRILIAMIADIV